MLKYRCRMLEGNLISSLNRDAEAATVRQVTLLMSDGSTLSRQTYFKPPSNLIFIVADEVTGLGTAGNQPPFFISENRRDLILLSASLLTSSWLQYIP